MSESATTVSGTTSMRPIAVSAFVGSALEWYDFGLYGWAAASVFQKLIFTSDDPLISMLGAFGSFAVGFLARPIGSVIFGHMGDRVGRKSMLVLTLTIMGVATILIGALPTAELVGPVVAVTLLTVLRVIQGIAVGGEFGGAALITAEHAPARRRAFWSSWTADGAPAGLLLSSGVFYAFTLLPDAQFYAWGWRIPFLLSAVILVVGALIRLRVQESPIFEAIAAAAPSREAPIRELLRSHKSLILRGAGARLVDAAAANVFTVFAVSYIVERAGLSPGLALGAGAIANAVHMCLIPVAATISDRVGRKPLIIGGAIGMGAMAAPGFALVNSGSTVLVVIGIVIAWPIWSVWMIGPTPAFLAELFPAHIRASGTSLVYQLQTIVAGVTPFIATSLLIAGGNQPWLIVAFIAGLAALTAICAATLPETAGRDLHETLLTRITDSIRTHRKDTTIR